MTTTDKQKISLALDIEEDLILGEIALLRSKQKVKYIPHEVVWKNIKKDWVCSYKKLR